MSQKLFAKAFPSQELQYWLAAHVDAFKFYGVLPTFAVPDNTKTGITSPNRYEPEFNLEYAEFARHYSLAVVPARVRKPRDKGKVENGVQRVEQRVLARLEGRTFLSLDELNDEISRLVEELNSRLMRGPVATRNELFEQIDRPAARPLPQTHYEFASWKKAKVGQPWYARKPLKTPGLRTQFERLLEFSEYAPRFHRIGCSLSNGKPARIQRNTQQGRVEQYIQ